VNCSPSPSRSRDRRRLACQPDRLAGQAESLPIRSTGSDCQVELQHRYLSYERRALVLVVAGLAQADETAIRS
jgi:hypothetical protein